MLIDVAINYYGKPWQTLLTVESLLRYSGSQIDLIYLISERVQPRETEDLGELLRRHADRLVAFTPSRYLGWKPASLRDVRSDPECRRSVRYQYALETTDKRYMLVSHNDVEYTADLAGELVRAAREGRHAGSGWVGQCWNCPARTVGRCDSDRQAELRLSYPAALRLALRVPSPRTRARRINPLRPVPLPECRLNEFSCLLDMDAYRRETMPWGSSPPFGFFTLDTGCAWFRSMVLKGYTFAHVDINQYCLHEAGHPDLFDPGAYERKEERAHSILEERYDLDAR